MAARTSCRSARSRQQARSDRSVGVQRKRSTQAAPEHPEHPEHPELPEHPRTPEQQGNRPSCRLQNLAVDAASADHGRDGSTDFQQSVPRSSSLGWRLHACTADGILSAATWRASHLPTPWQWNAADAEPYRATPRDHTPHAPLPPASAEATARCESGLPAIHTATRCDAATRQRLVTHGVVPTPNRRAGG